jgi:hypothetical protein
MRAKAKAFVEKQNKSKQDVEACKFCNGTTSNSKFVHEKFCVMAPEAKKTKCDST